MEADARKEKELGHDEKAGKLAIDAARKKQEGDTFGFDAFDLAHQRDSARPVADNLRRLGLGGDVGANSKDPILAQSEKQTNALNAALTVLKEIRDGKTNSATKASTGAFGR